jgi:transposase
LGNPLRVILSAGQLADIDYAAQTDRAPAGARGHRRQGLRRRPLRGGDRSDMGAQAVIPPRSNRLTPRAASIAISTEARNLIERFFARIKHFRRIATRYDKLASSFLSFVHLACAFVWLA